MLMKHVPRVGLPAWRRILGTKLTAHQERSLICVVCRRQPLASSRPLQYAQISSSAARRRTSGPRFIVATCAWGLRAFSTSPHLRQPDDRGNSNRDPPHARRPAGAGTLAKRGLEPSRQFGPGDGLLPNEREARKRSPPVSPAAPRDNAMSGRPAGRGRGRLVKEGQHHYSGAKMMDIFRKDRHPERLETPRSWSKRSTSDAEDENVQSTKSPRRQDQNNLRGGIDAPPRTGTLKAGLGQGPDASARAGFGAFSHRKARTIGNALKGNAEQSGLSPFEQMARDRHRLGGSSKDSDKGNDFWTNLESKVAQVPAERQPRRARRLQPVEEKETRDSGRQQVLGENSVGPDSVKPRRGSERSSSRLDRGDRGDTEGSQSQPERAVKRRNKQRVNRGSDEADYGEEETRDSWEERRRRREAKERRKSQQPRGPTPIFLPEYISVTALAEALSRRLKAFLGEMEGMGFENITADTIMTGETAGLIAQEYGFEPTVDTGSRRDITPRPPPEDVSLLPSRPPVVTIMGHVDHGKTTLLDWLRKSSVAANEHGGITQHIGAFVVKLSSGKAITFLDTPGHAAFLSMRQRGAKATDIVVLVVAADDSVMPQTLEALKHANAAKVPIIVAITKVDKDAARVSQVKADLSRHGVEIEDYGGDVQVVCVSGKTGQGMEDLEESIVTLSEVLDVRAERDGMAEGYVLESSVKQDGKVATILVKRGTLRVGDTIVAGQTWAKVRMLRNEAGIDVGEVPPGTPAEVLGWRELPVAGELVAQAPDEDRARTAVEYRQEMADREKSSMQLAEQEQRQRERVAAAEAEAARKEQAKKGIAVESEEEGPKMATQNFVVRADVLGSVEAVCGSILEQGNNEVRPRILVSQAGPVSESDVDHAAASDSIIVNFNSEMQPHIRQRAQAAKVRVLDHSVIYHVVDDVRAALAERLPPSIVQRVTGEADVLQVFSINVKKNVQKNIAGSRIRNGSVKRGSLVRVMRKGKPISTCTSPPSQPLSLSFLGPISLFLLLLLLACRFLQPHLFFLVRFKEGRADRHGFFFLS